VQPGQREAFDRRMGSRALAGTRILGILPFYPGVNPYHNSNPTFLCSGSVRGARVRPQCVLNVSVLPVVAKAVGEVPVDGLPQALLPARRLLPAQRRQLLVADEVPAGARRWLLSCPDDGLHYLVVLLPSASLPDPASDQWTTLKGAGVIMRSYRSVVSK